MKRIPTVWALLATGTMVLAGCATTVPYRALNDDCNCESYTARDPDGKMTSTVSASYRIDDGITTYITILMKNTGSDTLDLSLAYVKISSRNIPYHSNNKSIPLDILFVLPGNEETLRLEGHVDQGKIGDPWLKIAGEELEITLKGMRVGHRELAPQVVRFIPHNPNIGM